MENPFCPPTSTDADVKNSKNTVGRTCSTGDKAGQPHKPTDVYEFLDNSDDSSTGKMSENENEEEPYEPFEPPLHSTAIYTEEAELPEHCGSFFSSASQGGGAQRSLNISDTEENENESVKRAGKPIGKLQPISSESESSNESDATVEGKPAEKMSSRQRESAASSELSKQRAEFGAPEKRGPLSAKPAVEKENPATERQMKTQKKKMFCGKRKKSRNEATDSDTSDCAYIWCLKGKKSSDITELDVVLSAFEEILLEYRQNIESKVCKEAISKFHSSVKKELMKTLTEVQMSKTLKTLKRKNAKMISDIEKKRQHLIEVQQELLWLEPQLKQLQRKYDELKERKSSLRNATYFLSNLKQLHQDYSDIQEGKQNVKETYDSSSLPALLFKARTLIGAESHLQTINHQLEKLLAQK
ncbi:centromere protein U isoform X2 [Saccopteryx bilineata]|uniref:centromere protein U isoform X2 n=2 Tax=Saccopteryx bilineata TaxID=59482 RepID=UPI00338E2DDA